MLDLESGNRVPVLRFLDDQGNKYSEWMNTRLGDVCLINTGPFGTQLHESDYVKLGTPIVTVEHLGELGIRHTNLPLVSDFHRNKLKRYSLQSGDIIFSRVGSVDRNSIVSEKEEGWLFSGRLLRIRADDSRVISKFLSFSLQRETTKFRIRSVAVGQTMPSLNTTILSSFHVELPTTQEQQKIANFLSSVDTRIEQLEKKKALLEQYKKGLMQKLFSQEIRFKDDEGEEYPEWERNKLCEIARLLRGNGLSKSDIQLNGKSLCILYGELFTQYAEVIRDVVHSTDTEPSVVSNYGDILLPTSDVTPDGLATASAVLCEGVQIGSDIHIIRLNNHLEPCFVSYCINVNKRAILRIVTGSTVRHTSTKDISKIVLNIPSCKEEQQKIANFLSSLDRKIELIAEKIIKTREFKKGLLQQMFV